MKNYAIAILIIILSTWAFSQTGPDWLWVETASSSDYDYANDLDTDAAGNIYVTGRFSGLISFGATQLTGYADVFTGKLDPDGNWLWAVQASGGGVDTAYGIATDPLGNSYITGSFEGTLTLGTISLSSYGDKDIFVAKLDTDGNWLWANHAGGLSADAGYAMDIDSSGYSYITGYFTNSASFGDEVISGFGNWDIFAAKLDPAGNWIWAGEAGGMGYDVGWGISADDSGNFWVAGEFSQTAVFADTYLTSLGGSNCFICLVGSDLEMQWVERVGSTNMSSGFGVGNDGGGNCYLAGMFGSTAIFENNFGSITKTSEGETDAFIAKLDEYGTWLWANSCGGQDYDGAHDVSLSGDYVCITGFYYDEFSINGNIIPNSGFSDILLGRLDNAGNWIWAAGAGGPGLDNGNGIRVLPNGRCYVTGDFEGTASFGPLQETSAGQTEIFVLKLGIASIPLPPDNLSIVRYGISFELNWDPVTQDINGDPITPSHYEVYHCPTGPHGTFAPLGQSAGTTYVVPSAVTNCLGFFRVTAVVDGD